MDLRVSLSRQALNDRYKWVVKASGPGQVFGNVHPPWSGQLGQLESNLHCADPGALCALALNSALRCVPCAARASCGVCFPVCVLRCVVRASCVRPSATTG